MHAIRAPPLELRHELVFRVRRACRLAGSMQLYVQPNPAKRHKRWGDSEAQPPCGKLRFDECNLMQAALKKPQRAAGATAKQRQCCARCRCRRGACGGGGGYMKVMQQEAEEWIVHTNSVKGAAGESGCTSSKGRLCTNAASRACIAHRSGKYGSAVGCDVVQPCPREASSPQHASHGDSLLRSGAAASAKASLQRYACKVHAVTVPQRDPMAWPQCWHGRLAARSAV